MNSLDKLFYATLRSLWAASLTLLIAGAASANQYGVKTITTNTTLSDNQYGAVIFAANNITLDCAGYQVHISGNTTANCGASGTNKCGIVANGRSGITIKNCHVVGGFDYGVWLKSTTNARIETTDSNATTGYRFENNTGLVGYSLDANYCQLGGYELRSNTNTKLHYTWATGCGGDGYDENGGVSTTYDQDNRSTDNGVNGYECDSCQKILYGSFPVNSVGVRANNNGKHGISIDVSKSIWVEHSEANTNVGDGVRFQNVTNLAGALISEVVDSDAMANGVCDARSQSSPGDWWDFSSGTFFTMCGNFQD